MPDPDSRPKKGADTDFHSVYPPDTDIIACQMYFPQEISQANHQAKRSQDKEDPDEPFQTKDQHRFQKERDDDEAHQQGGNGKHIDSPTRDMSSAFQHHEFVSDLCGLIRRYDIWFFCQRPASVDNA